MKKIAFLSMDSLADFFTYDDLLIAPFAQAGYAVSTVSWRDESHDFTQYESVIVRSPWDYQQAPDAFMACLARLADQTMLINPLALMQWNLDKHYLADMAEQSVPVLPTLWLDSFCYDTLSRAFAQFNSDEIVLKPCISANADDTYRLSPKALHAQRDTLAAIFLNRSAMVQPFVKSVIQQGEVSLFYFAGELSHAILKTPKPGDFRVQEEHGGTLSVSSPSPDMLQTALQALNAMPTDYLYARVDLLLYQQQWCTIELELIEPSLYFNLDDASPSRFVNAYLRYMANKNS